MRALRLIDHGSRRVEGNALSAKIAAELQEGRPELIVRYAHLEIATPTIAEGFLACVEAGATEVVAVPFFLGPGRHTAQDLPREMAQAAAQCLDRAGHRVPFRVAAPLAPSPLLHDLLLSRFDEVDFEC